MRIRSIKPEWLSDEKLASLPDPERVLSVGLILIADDHGRGRANPAFIRSTVWPYADPPETLGNITERLRKVHEAGFIRLYRVDEQDYYEICNWLKHQRVSHPGAPLVPLPPETLGNIPESFVPETEREIEKEIEREGEKNAPAPDISEGPDPKPLPWMQVVKTWIEVGSDVTKGEVVADMYSHKKPATALLALAGGDVAQLAHVVRAYWRAKAENGKRPAMRFLVEDYDRYAHPPGTATTHEMTAAEKIGLRNDLTQAKADEVFEREQGNESEARRYEKLIKNLSAKLGAP